MMKPLVLRIAAAVLIGLLAIGVAHAADTPFEPVSGQAGKDVVWVPTPASLVEKMLDLAKVTPRDFVMDLGSGDGRNIIAAARRGARALGVEFNPDMVELSRREAQKAGLADKASFVQGDMFEADLSQATVLALFLLPENLGRLVPKFLDLKPGSRIVLNTFGIRDWEPDEVERAGEECGAWCEVLLYIVPAKVAGEWQFLDGRLSLAQSYQTVTGTFESVESSVPVTNAVLRGDSIRFSVNGTDYVGVVDGDAMRAATGASWRAQRIGAQ